MVVAGAYSLLVPDTRKASIWSDPVRVIGALISMPGDFLGFPRLVKVS